MINIENHTFKVIRLENLGNLPLIPSPNSEPKSSSRDWVLFCTFFPFFLFSNDLWSASISLSEIDPISSFSSFLKDRGKSGASYSSWRGNFCDETVRLRRFPLDIAALLDGFRRFFGWDFLEGGDVSTWNEGLGNFRTARQRKGVNFKSLKQAQWRKTISSGGGEVLPFQGLSEI